MRRSKRLIGMAVAFAALVGLVFPGTAARATFPGVDGRIAFSDFLTGQIYAINPDGSGLVQLTHVKAGAAAEWPDWSPDGRHIAFDSDKTGSLRLWVMNADGSHKRMVAEDGPRARDQLPTYTPDGKRLVYMRCVPGACAIYSVMTDGTHRRQLTPLQGPPFEVFDLWPSVSPDGKWIAFERFNQNVNGIISQVYVMRSDGSDPHPVTRPALEGGTPDWSPNGRRIAFDGPCCKHPVNIYTIGMDGSGLEKLTNLRFPHNAVTPSYSPSGTRVAYASDQEYPDLCCTDLFVMSANGTQQTLIYPGGSGIQAVAWGTAPPIAADTGRVPTIPTVSPAQAAAQLAAQCRMLPRPLRLVLRCAPQVSGAEPAAPGRNKEGA